MQAPEHPLSLQDPKYGRTVAPTNVEACVTGAAHAPCWRSPRAWQLGIEVEREPADANIEWSEGQCSPLSVPGVYQLRVSAVGTTLVRKVTLCVWDARVLDYDPLAFDDARGAKRPLAERFGPLRALAHHCAHHRAAGELLTALLEGGADPEDAWRAGPPFYAFAPVYLTGMGGAAFGCSGRQGTP